MTTTRQKAPCILTEVGARRLTARIRDALAVADDLLAQAYQGRAWEALGYDSWPSYCSAELPELRHLKMRTEPRRERVRALLAEGATERDIAAATGSAPVTAHRDVLAVTGRAAPYGAAEPAEEPQADAPVPMAKTDRVVALVASQGDKGMTCLEVEHEMSWRHGVASGPFSTVARQKRIRSTGRFRQGYGVYVVS